jgi:hypothetical protein
MGASHSGGVLPSRMGSAHNAGPAEKDSNLDS